jgi:hypothetical protein
MNKKYLIIVSVAVVLVGAGVGFWLGQSSSVSNPDEESQYSAVYMTTGDIYFGKLNWFPWPRIKDAWGLQRSQSGASIAPMKSAAWGPTGDLYLNPKEIVTWTRLLNSSPLAKALANPASVQNAQQSQQVPPPPLLPAPTK